jgi:hypothetical protein
MPLLCHIVMVTIDSDFSGREVCEHVRHDSQHTAHHDFPVHAGKGLCPGHEFHVIREIVRSLGKIGQILVRQGNEEPLHVLLGQLDEMVADPVTNSARPGMQHYPDTILLIETYLDEVITRPERSEMVDTVRLPEPGMTVTEITKSLFKGTIAIGGT